MAIAMAMGMAMAFHQRGLLRFLSLFSLLGALFLGVAMAVFALDAMQFLSSSPAENLPALRGGAVIAELKHITGFVALVLLGLGGWTTSGRIPGSLPADGTSRTSDLVVKPGAGRE
jgi:hypothetical protein